MGQQDTSDFLDLPGGEYFAYLVNASHNEATLGVISLDGTQHEGVLEGMNTTSRISPDQSRIAFVYGVYPEFALRVLDLSTGYIIELGNSSGCQSPSWGPDSDHIVAICEDVITIFGISANSRVELSGGAFSDPRHAWTYSAWSPNGEYIALYSSVVAAGPGSDGGVFLLPTACLEKPDTCAQVLRGPTFAVDTDVLLWSSDSRLLAIHNGPIALIDVATDQATLLGSEVVDGPAGNSSIAWAPGDTAIAYSRQDGVYLVTFPDLRVAKFADVELVLVFSFKKK